MRLPTLLAGLAFCLLLPFHAAMVCHAESLDEAQFRKLHAELQPSPESAWRRIPWKISLLDAQQTAVDANKPIFIWAMDGHPLGCT